MSDTIARVGGDEFVVVQILGDRPDLAEASAARVIVELSKPFTIAGEEVLIGASVGIALYPSDILFNPLPIFHCFGLTVGVVMPLLLGIKVVLHPTPLQPREIVRRIKDSGATILLSTDTFISQYARAGDQGDLNSLRLAVCGAERLRDETRALLRKKYNIELLEGYGVTEAGGGMGVDRDRALAVVI